MGARGAGQGPFWLVINLDRSPDRLAAVGADLGTLGIPFARVPAVDGRALPPSLPGVDPELYRRSHGRDVLPGEVGCALSHLRALRAFLATPHRHAVVLEDDAVVTRAAADLVSALVDPAAPDDWDLVKLEAHHSRLGLTARRIAPGVRLCALPYRSAGSAAYLVNRAAAEALLAGILPMRFPYDVAFERGWDFGIRVRTVLPLPVTTAPVPPVLARDDGACARRRAPALPRAAAKAMFAASALCAWAGAGRRSRTAVCPAGFDLADRALAGCRPSSVE
ncbi:glycosyltransferase family 25 protein [Lichenibacterium dinghuense]|uniref:glycosyltransferase family 25 protein n=1 Tax=Lichenibacterium dinghuense TaxID=2895977 RepID=UPI001F1CD094|nr:glycosyltransferase family 25 protein [Lichenibacterium sp. 6Y81]